MHELLAIWAPSFPELMVVLVLALLIFGKRLPDVARNLGKGIVEFKKGVRNVEDEIDRVEHDADASASRQRNLDPPRGS